MSKVRENNVLKECIRQYALRKILDKKWRLKKRRNIRKETVMMYTPWGREIPGSKPSRGTGINQIGKYMQ